MVIQANGNGYNLGGKMTKKIISLLLVFTLMLAIAIPTGAYGVDKDYAGHWAEDTIQSWLDDGYINGYSDGNFVPEGLVTRAEFVKMVNNLFDYTEKIDINFADVNQSDWYYQEIQKAFKAGYIAGVSETQFAPNDNLTREQAAVIISKIMKLDLSSTGTNAFTDSNKISTWAKDYVDSAAAAQLFKGYGDNSFKPQNPIKRAEAVVTLNKTINKTEQVDLIIDKAGTVVENKIVKNLRITKGVGDGGVTIKNVTITGEMLVEGGGQNSITIEDSVVNKLTTNKSDGTVRILIEGKTSVDYTSVKYNTILEQQKLTGLGFEEVTVDEDSSVLFVIDKNVRWVSSDSNVASINAKGLVIAKNIGTAIISVTTIGGKKTLVSEVTVIKTSVPEDSTSSKTVKILAIGNSFSEDATYWIYDIAKSAGVNVIIGNLYLSGCSLETHWSNAMKNNATYSYCKWTSSAVTKTTNQTMKASILDEDWDFITFQQASGESGFYNTFQPYLNNLVSYAKGIATNTNVKLALNMTWAYATNSTNESFVNYGNNQITMYNSITNAFQQAISETNIDIVIPCGTAIQNARTNMYLSVLGEELTLDGYHLNEGIGRYIAGLTFFETLVVNNENIKKDLLTEATFIPDTIDSTEDLAYLAKIAVMNAVENPFEITKIQNQMRINQVK